MKSTLILAFSAAAFAQSVYVNGTACPGVVVETVYTTYYTCPCSSTTGLASNTASSSSSSTTPSVDVGTGSDTGPILTGTTGSVSTSSLSATSNSASSASSFSSVSTSIATPLSTSSASTSSGAVVTTAASSTTLSTTTTTTAAAVTTASGTGRTRQVSLASLGDYQSRALYAHNLHRANASIPNLVWNATQATYAQQLANTCVYGHSRAQGDGNYGQNIGAGFTADQIPRMITNAMYNGEIGFYPGPYGQDNIDTSNFSRWGHYSQLVWRDTTSVGCATTYCPQGLANAGRNIPPYFTVCNYYPSGNYVGSWSRVAAPVVGGDTIEFVP